MASWTNATGALRGGPAEASGLLHPRTAAPTAGLRREYPLSPALEPFVERHWSVSWDRTGLPPFRSEVLSHPCVNLSVESGDGPRHGVALPAALVHGVVRRRFVIDLRGRGRCTAVKFRPGGYTAFTGRRARPGSVSTLGEPGDLVQDVLDHDADDDRAAVLDGFLAARAPEPGPDYLALARLVTDVSADRTLVRVDQVAERAALSTRSLQRLFSSFVGVGPKWVLARYRLQDAAALIDAGDVDDLAALAADLGWYDQSHFSRDFRAAVGVTPSAYLAVARAGVPAGTAG